MTANEARHILRDMRRRGVITVGEWNDALVEIEKGRGTAAVAFLRKQVS